MDTRNLKADLALEKRRLRLYEDSGGFLNFFLRASTRRKIERLNSALASKK